MTEMNDLHSTPPRDADGPIVLIACEAVLAAWSASAARPSGLLALADVDDRHALAVIERRRPKVVVLEQLFASSARGITFVSRLRGNAQLAGLDIRVLPAARSAILGSAAMRAGHALVNAAQPLPDGPIRRAPRIPMPRGIELRVEGTRTALINVSPFGAQVVSTKALKPNQHVEVILKREGVDLRTRAEIVWSSLELALTGMTYRAGLSFSDPQPEVAKLEAIAAAHAA